VIVHIRGEGLNVPEVTVSGGGLQARPDAASAESPVIPEGVQVS